MITQLYQELTPRKRKMTPPSDPIMLFSWVNTMLRDRYVNLDTLCDDMDIDRKELERKLASVGFQYQEAINQFR